MILIDDLVRCGDNYPYIFKGARSAPGPAGRRSWAAPREDDADLDAAQLPPVTRRAFRGNVARLGAACRS